MEKEIRTVNNAMNRGCAVNPRPLLTHAIQRERKLFWITIK